MLERAAAAVEASEVKSTPPCVFDEISLYEQSTHSETQLVFDDENRCRKVSLIIGFADAMGYHEGMGVLQF